jgi:hypothetical protein
MDNGYQSIHSTEEAYISHVPRCAECGSDSIVAHHRDGHHVCQDCGVIISGECFYDDAGPSSLVSPESAFVTKLSYTSPSPSAPESTAQLPVSLRRAIKVIEKPGIQEGHALIASICSKLERGESSLQRISSEYWTKVCKIIATSAPKRPRFTRPVMCCALVLLAARKLKIVVAARDVFSFGGLDPKRYSPSDVVREMFKLSRGRVVKEFAVPLLRHVENYIEEICANVAISEADNTKRIPVRVRERALLIARRYLEARTKDPSLWCIGSVRNADLFAVVCIEVAMRILHEAARGEEDERPVTMAAFCKATGKHYQTVSNRATDVLHGLKIARPRQLSSRKTSSSFSMSAYLEVLGDAPG